MVRSMSRAGGRSIAARTSPDADIRGAGACFAADSPSTSTFRRRSSTATARSWRG